LPGSMTWMGIRLSSGSRRPQSPKKGLPLHLLNRFFCSYGPVVVEWPEMFCAWSSQYPHRPIPPDQSRSVYRSSAAPRCASTCSSQNFPYLDDLPAGAQLIGTETRAAPGSGLWWRLRRHSPPRQGTDHDSKPLLLLPEFRNPATISSDESFLGDAIDK
jgi:hypothetical protein